MLCAVTRELHTGVASVWNARGRWRRRAWIWAVLDSAGWLLITKTPFATRDYSRRNSVCWRPDQRAYLLTHRSQNYRVLRSVFHTHARPLLYPAASERVNHSMEKMWVGDKSCDGVGLKLNGTDERSLGYLWSFLFHIELRELWG